jgi:hypothetical protein
MQAILGDNHFRSGTVRSKCFVRKVTTITDCLVGSFAHCFDASPTLQARPSPTNITSLLSGGLEKSHNLLHNLVFYLLAAIMYSIENPSLPYWGLFLVLCGSCVALTQFLNPPDLKWPRKKWVMPTGPQGVPLLGNLLQMMQARRGAVSLNNWVSHQVNEHEKKGGLN